MDTIGRHILVDLYDCYASVLNDADRIRDHMLAACALVGAEVVSETTRQYYPQGVSSLIMIAESHLSIHTWPECGYAAVDLYTCGNTNPRACVEHLARNLRAERLRSREILRGLPSDIARRRIETPVDAISMIDLARNATEFAPQG